MLASPEKVRATLYEKIGGNRTINKAMKYFYTCISQDKTLAPHFAPLHLSEKSKQHQELLTEMLGGPTCLPKSDITDAFEGLEKINLSEDNVNTINELIEASLIYAGVEENLIEEIMELLTRKKQDVIKKINH